MAKNRKGRNWVPWMEAQGREHRMKRLCLDRVTTHLVDVIFDFYKKPRLDVRCFREGPLGFSGQKMQIPLQYQKEEGDGGDTNCTLAG